MHAGAGDRHHRDGHPGAVLKKAARVSLAKELAILSEAESNEVLAELTPEQLESLAYDWATWARPEQLPPELGNDGMPWNTWVYLAGRGTGKTRAGAEWLRAEVCGATPLGAGRRKRFAIIGETSKDVRDVLIEGESGLLAVHPRDFRPIYKPSVATLEWPNGARATLYNGTEPDQLRGPQFDGALVDELAKYRYAQDTWDMLQFGLRLGNHPRAMVTTTPRPIKLLKDLVKDPKSAVTRGKTEDNAENLAASFLLQVRARYAGTRLGRQELDAELLEDVPGALWRRSNLDEYRVKPAGLPDMKRIVVAVDPAAKAKDSQRGENGAETGIVTCGLGVDGRGYVLDDSTTIEGPDKWGRLAVAAYDRNQADAIVAEINNGGDMVPFVIRSVRDSIKVIVVTASRGKVTRAEPVSALYEQGRVSHVGSFAALEDQMCAFTVTDADDVSLKDRTDALVWAFTELFPALVTVKKRKWADKWAGRRGWMG
jgi:phage terminase large subunit-like protein